MNTEQPEEPRFAEDQTDGRPPGDWKTRYTEPEAKKEIRKEALYLGLLLAVFSVSLFLVLLEKPQDWLHLSGDTLKYFNMSVGAWVAGTLGGTVSSIKWLYHKVAHNFWNIDRRLWRYFTPHISGALALIVIITVSSGLFNVFDSDSTDKLTFVIALGFLTGYFSDSAAGKLSDIAITIFGSKGHDKKG